MGAATIGRTGDTGADTTGRRLEAMTVVTAAAMTARHTPIAAMATGGMTEATQGSMIAATTGATLLQAMGESSSPAIQHQKLA